MGRAFLLSWLAGSPWGVPAKVSAKTSKMRRAVVADDDSGESGCVSGGEAAISGVADDDSDLMCHRQAAVMQIT
jgi:hypothetical protein